MNMQKEENKGLQASVDGFAHEHIVVGILMKKFKNVSLVDLPLSPYDIIVVLDMDGREVIIRAQVKTSTKSISFTGGARGGVDRTYKSNVKTYVQSTQTSDVIIGIKANENGGFDLFFIPTILVEKLGQKSVSIKKVDIFKNNYQVLERCLDEKYVLDLARSRGLIT